MIIDAHIIEVVDEKHSHYNTPQFSIESKRIRLGTLVTTRRFRFSRAIQHASVADDEFAIATLETISDFCGINKSSAFATVLLRN